MTKVLAVLFLAVLAAFGYFTYQMVATGRDYTSSFGYCFLALVVIMFLYKHVAGNDDPPEDWIEN